MTLREVRELWFVVFLDCLAAVCSIVPILCVPAMWYLLMNYSVTWVQFRTEQNKTPWRCLKSTTAVRALDVARTLSEVILWMWLAQCNIRAWMDVLHFMEILSDKSSSDEKTANMLTNVIQYTQVNFIRSSLCACTVFFWRSFQWHSDKAESTVGDQKRWNDEKLQKRRDDPGFSRALNVLDRLRTNKPWCQYFRAPPPKKELDKAFHQLDQTAEKQDLLQHPSGECHASAPTRGFEDLAEPGEIWDPNENEDDEEEATQQGWLQYLSDSMNLIIAGLSTVGISAGVLLMSVGPELEARNKLFEDQGQVSFALVWWWVNMSASVALMSDGWARLLWSLLKATDSFRDNITQVLIFSCLGRLTQSWSHLSRGLESYSYRNRCRAKRLLDSYEGAEPLRMGLSSKPGVQAEDACKERKGARSRMCPCWRLSPTLTCGDAKVLYHLLHVNYCQLSFASGHDLQAWWLLRQYVHIDLSDEAAQMEFVGVMVAGFLGVFALFVSLDLLLNYSLISRALLLTYLSSSPFILLMWRVFSYGIDINSLLIRDAQVLSDAATWAAFFPQEMWVREEPGKAAKELPQLNTEAANDTAKLILQLDLSTLQRNLSTLQRNTEVHEHIQTLLGIRVTSSLLAGWIVSLVVTLLTWLRGLASQVWSIEWLSEVIREQEFFW